MAADELSLKARILAEILAERHRQDEKWGGQPGIHRTSDAQYAAVLGEEFGEVCQSWLELDVENLRTELIQVAAVAMAWVEEIDIVGSARANDWLAREQA